jgi:hypothetical protein
MKQKYLIIRFNKKQRDEGWENFVYGAAIILGLGYVYRDFDKYSRIYEDIYRGDYKIIINLTKRLKRKGLKAWTQERIEF